MSSFIALRSSIIAITASIALFASVAVLNATPGQGSALNADLEDLASGRLYAGFRNRELADNPAIRQDLLSMLDYDLATAYEKHSRGKDITARKKIETAFGEILRNLSRDQAGRRIATARLSATERTGTLEFLMEGDPGHNDGFDLRVFYYELSEDGSLGRFGFPNGLH
ncbi:MAG: hypothetical protein NXI24_21260 [bacterium]|nr:hypothetical protein [bacterium]